jgi:ribosomal protein L12E/L44/L45/RPP1/RPP2
MALGLTTALIQPYYSLNTHFPGNVSDSLNTALVSLNTASYSLATQRLTSVSRRVEACTKKTVAQAVASGHDSEQLQEAMVQSQPACALVAAPKNKGGRPRKNKMEADPKQKSLVFTPSQHCVLPEELAGTDDIDGPALGTAASAAASSSGSQAPVAAGPKPKKKRDGQQRQQTHTEGSENRVCRRSNTRAPNAATDQQYSWGSKRSCTCQETCTACENVGRTISQVRSHLQSKEHARGLLSLTSRHLSQQWPGH